MGILQREREGQHPSMQTLRDREEDLPRSVKDGKIDGRLGRDDDDLDSVSLGKDGSIVGTDLASDRHEETVNGGFTAREGEGRTLLAVSPLRTTRSAPTTRASI